MLIVYLSNRYIRIVEGDSSGKKVAVHNAHYTVDTKGCILNGIVTDEEAFTELIQMTWESSRLPKKGVHLVIDSNQFTTKVTDVPFQKPKQMLEFVSREFNDVERIEDPIYSYFPLPGQTDKKAKIQSVFATMAPSKYIRDYVELFDRLGIKIEGIESARGAALRLVALLPQVREKTCVVQFVDDMSLINILLYQGLYVYSGRNRLFSEPGTVEYAVEIARSVSNILQFAKAQNISDAVKYLYVAGLEKEDFETYADSIPRIDSELQAECLKAGGEISFRTDEDGKQRLSQFAIPIGGLIQTDSRTNLITQIVKNPEKEAEKKKKRKVLVPILSIAVVLAAVSAFLGLRSLYLTQQLQTAQAYNQNPSVLEACEKYDVLSGQLKAIGALNTNLTGLEEQVLAYPRIDSRTEQIVAGCASGLVTAKISGYSSENGVLSFYTSATRVEQIHRFIDLLSQQEIFSSVDYTGYSQDSDGNWNVKVNCTMAGRQEDEK